MKVLQILNDMGLKQKFDLRFFTINNCYNRKLVSSSQTFVIVFWHWRRFDGTDRVDSVGTYRHTAQPPFLLPSDQGPLGPQKQFIKARHSVRKMVHFLFQ